MQNFTMRVNRLRTHLSIKSIVVMVVMNSDTHQTASAVLVVQVRAAQVMGVQLADVQRTVDTQMMIVMTTDVQAEMQMGSATHVRAIQGSAQINPHLKESAVR